MLRLERDLLRYRAGFLVVLLFLFFLLVLLPFSVASVVSDMLGLPNGQIFTLFDAPDPEQPGTPFAHFHIAIVNLEEGQQLVSLRVAAERRCVDGCPDDLVLSLISLNAREVDAENPPAIATVAIKGGSADTTQTVTLPVIGNPVRYPFDTYDLRLALLLERAAPGQQPRRIPRETALGQLKVTAREHLTRMTMAPPRPAPSDVAAQIRPRGYLSEFTMTFERPLYLRVLAIALVLLIAAAAAGAVFMRPITDLFISSGSLVIGVWGVRSILVPGTPTFLTAVDLSLSVVILFLLSAIIVRLAFFFQEKGQLPKPVPRLRRGQDDERPVR